VRLAAAAGSIVGICRRTPRPPRKRSCSCRRDCADIDGDSDDDGADVDDDGAAAAAAVVVASVDKDAGDARTSWFPRR